MEDPTVSWKKRTGRQGIFLHRFSGVWVVICRIKRRLTGQIKRESTSETEASLISSLRSMKKYNMFQRLVTV